MSDIDSFLEHYGVKGMKWGVRTDRSGATSLRVQGSYKPKFTDAQIKEARSSAPGSATAGISTKRETVKKITLGDRTYWETVGLVGTGVAGALGLATVGAIPVATAAAIAAGGTAITGRAHTRMILKALEDHRKSNPAVRVNIDVAGKIASDYEKGKKRTDAFLTQYGVLRLGSDGSFKLDGPVKGKNTDQKAKGTTKYGG